jgi:protein involved in polysaccharide export with SLBB domain
VFSPGVYQYADNTTIEDLIMQAGGLTDAASTAKVDISRRIIDPKATKSSKEIAKTYSFSLKDGFIVDGTPGFKLEPYDVVQVRRSPGFQTPRMITVSGEVMFKGEFALAYKNQRLSDAIRAAGGVTDQAYVRGARLFRQMDEAERMRQEAVLNAIRNNMTRKDSISMGKLQLDPVYPVGIDLEKALANPGTDADIVLREGDRIDVPEFNGTVKIVGDVQFPNTVTYVEGKSYKWYVNNAGGFAETAKKRKTFIIYPNGMMSKVSSNTKVEPGSEIVVPSKKPRNMGSLTQWISAITGLASLSSMVMAIAYLTKK